MELEWIKNWKQKLQCS